MRSSSLTLRKRFGLGPASGASAGFGSRFTSSRRSTGKPPSSGNGSGRRRGRRRRPASPGEGTPSPGVHAPSGGETPDGFFSVVSSGEIDTQGGDRAPKR